MKEIPFCPDPFTFLSKDRGRFLTCCPGWMHESRYIYGNFDNLWEVWNHPSLVEWREALLQGDYRWCQRCPNRFRQRDRQSPLLDEKPIMDRPPITFQILNDERCNLRCPSCRPRVITEDIGDKWTPQLVTAQMPEIQTIAMSLAGDPFASPTCMEFLRQSGTPDVILWTNGILLPRFWQEIKRKVTVVVISIDAATKETYEQLRQPAKWEQIQHTLDFVRVLVACKEVLLFQINMVVQQANFREIPEFIAMGKRHLAHIVQFCLIAPWPHITRERWSQVNIANPDHPEHQDFLRVLQDPILHSPGVDAGFINDGSLDFYGHSRAETNFWFDPLK